MSVYTGDVYTGGLNNTTYACQTDARVHYWDDPTVVDFYIPVKDFSSALRAMMAIKQLTNEQLGKQLGLNRETIRHWALGLQKPRGNNLKKLCEFLSIDEDAAKMLIKQEEEKS